MAKFTISLDPETESKLRMIAARELKSSISKMVGAAMKSYVANYEKREGITLPVKKTSSTGQLKKT